MVLEPGAVGLTLAEAVAYASAVADDDAWVVRASGPIPGFRNALIPSADDALTGRNYRARRGRRRRAAASRAARRGGGGREEGSQAARLYAGVVEAGVVTAATWRVIRMLPPEAREQYERLTADTVLLYPRKLVAGSAEEYRDLRDRLEAGGLDWEQALDLDRMELVERRRLDAGYVTLRYPVGALAGRIREQRARAAGGKGAEPELVWKRTANTLYGALTCPDLPTFNAVAANQVTAGVRAVAFLLGQSLNAIQAITDGCTYRRDQVPAGTFAACVNGSRDYPLRRAEAGGGVPFLPAGKVPADDAGFNAWLPGHLARFFETTEDAVRGVLGGHAVEHKGGAFDALGCDGGGNYLKCVDRGGRWEVAGFAARGCGRGAKRMLEGYLVRTFAGDRVADLPPVAEDEELLAPRQAAAAARAALRGGVGEVRLPLGLGRARVVNYKLIKPSAFVFATPAQRATVLRQWRRFERATGAGPELLAFRRSYARGAGSLADVAEAIRAVIGSGGTRLAAALNLSKLGDGIKARAAARQEAIETRKARGREEFAARLVVDPFEAAWQPTGIRVTRDDPPLLVGE